MGRGCERVGPIVNEEPNDHVPVNESPLIQEEVIKDDEDVENAEEVGQKGEIHAETTSVPFIDPILSQNIMSF